jgi:hypothetical protein
MALSGVVGRGVVGRGGDGRHTPQLVHLQLSPQDDPEQHLQSPQGPILAVGSGWRKVSFLEIGEMECVGIEFASLNIVV